MILFGFLLFYALMFFWISNFGNLKSLQLRGSIFTSVLGGLVLAALLFFGGPAFYLMIHHQMLFWVTFLFYITVVFLLAFVKFKENGLMVLILAARRRKMYLIHEFVLSVDGLPLILSKWQKSTIFWMLYGPAFLAAMIAAAFARSDWKYEIASPLIGMFSVAMFCLLVYGNFISFFYWIYYLRNKERYAEFANWPREQFADKG